MTRTIDEDAPVLGMFFLLVIVWIIALAVGFSKGYLKIKPASYFCKVWQT